MNAVRAMPRETPAPTGPTSDPRVAAFLKLVEAVDRTDTQGTLRAMRELRPLGYSIVVLNTTAGKGGRG